MNTFESQSETQKRFLAARWVLVLLVGVSLYLGCAEEPASSFPDDVEELASPRRVVVHPSGAPLFVVNSNRNRRYSASWISTLDIDGLIDSAQGNATQSVVTDRLFVPNLATDLAFSDDGTVGAVVSLGSEPTTIVQWEDGRLHCGNASSTEGLSTALSRTDCDAEHFIELFQRILPEQATPQRSDFSLEFDARNFLDPYQVTIERIGTERLALVSFINGFQAQSVGGGGFLAVINISDALAARYETLLSLGRRALGKPIRIDEDHIVFYEAQDAERLYDLDISQGLSDTLPSERTILQDALIDGAQVTASSYRAEDGQLYVTTASPDAIWGITVRDTQLFDEGEQSLQSLLSYQVDSYLPIAGTPTSMTLLPNQRIAVTLFERNSVLVVENQDEQLTAVARFDGLADGVIDSAFVQADGGDYLVISSLRGNQLSVIDMSGSVAGFRTLGTFP